MNMRYFYTLWMMIAVHYTFAQTDLYISNNANTYMYVDGSVFTDTPGTNIAPLFVTHNITLAGGNSFIYLHNDGQLIQSSSSTGNSGTGDLSVYQEGNSSAYQYNYWCSPIGSKSNPGASDPFGVSLLNDVVDVKTSIPAAVSHHGDYNGTANPLDIEERWIYTYTTPSNLYSDWIPNYNTITINPGEGFTMKGTIGTSANNPGNNQRYDFRGKPNTGTFALNVAAPVGGVPQQTLVGNPYPSALDARAYLHDPQNAAAIDATLYYWEQASTTHLIAEYEGGYATYTINAAGTVDTYSPAVFLSYDGAGNDGPATGGVGTKIPKRYIAIGQGFMVQGKTGSSGTVRVKNNMRVFYKESSSNSQFFRTTDSSSTGNDPDEIMYNENGLSLVPAGYKRFRVNVEFNHLYKRQLVQNFHASATNGLDRGLEAKSPEGVASDAYWVLDDEPYVIQAFSFDENLTIPLVIKLTEAQPIGFSMFDIQNFDASQPIFIHDIETGQYVDLRTQNYEINLPAGIYNSRFEITFTQQTLNSPEVTGADFKIFQDNRQSQLTIFNPNGRDIKSVQLFDIAGKQIFDFSNLANDPEYHFTTKSISEGVYIASLRLEDNQVISKKVIIKN